tara:strand:- start:10621 stop:11112 length:492 start_codon:yes stop_codon:yes gene_type:complete
MKITKQGLNTRSGTMKISKTRLKEIIKEELSGLGEGDRADRMWADNPANTSRPGDADSAAGYPNAGAALADIATQLGGEEFAATVSQAIAAAAGGLNTDQALDLMSQALQKLSLPMREADTPDEKEEPLVLPDRGAAGVKKSRERLKQQANDAERRKKLRYKK